MQNALVQHSLYAEYWACLYIRARVDDERKKNKSATGNSNFKKRSSDYKIWNAINRPMLQEKRGICQMFQSGSINSERI